MDDGPHQRAQQLHIAHIEVAIGDFLGNEARRDATQTQTAVILGQVDTDQAEGPHFPEQRPVNTRLRLTLLVIGPELLACKAARHVTQRNLIVIKNHGYISWLTAAKTTACCAYSSQKQKLKRTPSAKRGGFLLL